LPTASLVEYTKEVLMMSGKTRKEVQAQSTVEAIRMASASVLGATTGLGYPIGSAIGSGSMLEQHSETVSMNIAPLIFKVRDSIINSEGLELLCIEWNLGRTPGPDVLPEQLVVSGGSEGGVGSHVCVLSWEKGVVDPFKIDQYVKVLSKKLGDIETAVINNELNYELEGLSIIQRFADRLNSVLFVDMLDRRFQGSWDSLQIRPEQLVVEAVARMAVRDDFTLVPPGLAVVKRTALDFRLPKLLEGDILDHFQHRILTPSAIQMLTETVPEMGQAILEELNTYAYSMEEADIAQAAISTLKEYIGRDTVTPSELNSIKSKAQEYENHLQAVMHSLDGVVEKHTSSGKTLSVEGHREDLLATVDSENESFEGIRHALAGALINQFMKSVERESIGVQEIRAWQLKSTLNYAVAYGKRVAHYFASELNHYLLVSSARNAFLTALRDFRTESVQEGMDSTDLMLFEKFYTAVESQLNASFSKKSYRGEQYHDFIQLMESITREMIETFKRIDVWNLIDFSDVAEIARLEIRKKFSDAQGSDRLTSEGQALMDLLDKFQTTVSDIIPDVADTILSKPLIRKMIDRMSSDGTSLSDELASTIETAGEKSEEWRKEAATWIEGFRESVDSSQSLPQRLLTLLQYVHELLAEVVSPSAMADRVKNEADAREAVYKAAVDQWQDECSNIENENGAIRQSNKLREEILAEATRQFEDETAAYQRQLRDYNEKIEKRRNTATATPEVVEPVSPPPLEPVPPSPLERRLDIIKREHLLQTEKPLPPKPQPEPSLRYYVELRDLLYDKLTEMKERQASMEDTFARRILRLQAEGMNAVGEISINIGDDFLEYLMGTEIRRLGRLLPRISRVFLRNPKDSDLLYLVSYEHFDDALTASIGSIVLR
jgi:hypothetical protein